MNKFTRVKIEFVISLLAITLSLNPIISQVGEVSITILTINISLRSLYNISLTFLGISAYAFLLDSILKKESSRLQQLGRISCVIAVVLPLFFLIAWIVSMMYAILDKMASPVISQIVSTIVFLILGYYFGKHSNNIQNLLGKKHS